MKELIPVLSLVVAALAVFVAPLIARRIGRGQIASSLAVANKQITAPMRQAWINSLRDTLARLLSRALHYHVAGFEERTDAEYRHLTLLEYRVLLMLNPNEGDHQRLEKLIQKMIASIQDPSGFPEIHTAVKDLSREILKREWNVVKEKIQ